MEQNITVDPSQSVNFFSNLQQSVQSQSSSVHETSKEIAIESDTITNSEKLDSDTAEFLNKTNGSQRNLGHNRLHQRIEELQTELAKYKTTQKEQEMKLNLFKKTISTLQTQLQEKSSHISNLERDTENTTVTSQLQQQLQQRDQDYNVIKTNMDNFMREYDYIKTLLEKTLNERDTVLHKNEELKQRNQLLESSFDKQTREFQSQSDVVAKFENRIALEVGIRNNLETELQELRKELSQYRTDIKNVTAGKDIEIERLTQQLHNLLQREIPSPEPDAILPGSPGKIQQRNAQGVNRRNIQQRGTRRMQPTTRDSSKPI